MNEQKRPTAAAERQMLRDDVRQTIRRYRETRDTMQKTIDEAHRRLVEARRWLEDHRDK